MGSLSEKINERLKKKQEKKEFKDTEIVSYTRKYKRAYDLISIHDLDELEKDNVNAYQQVVKDKVWKEYDIQEQKENGYSSGVTYLKVKLREALAKRPFDSKQSRELYVKVVEMLKIDLDSYFKVSEFAEKLYETYTSNSFYSLIDSYVYNGRRKDFLKSILGARFYNYVWITSDSYRDDLYKAMLYEKYTKEQQDIYVDKAIENKNLSLNKVKENIEYNTNFVKEKGKTPEGLITLEQYFYNNFRDVVKQKDIKKGIKENPQEWLNLLLSVDEHKYKRITDDIENLKNRINLPKEKQVREENWEWSSVEGGKKDVVKKSKAEINQKIPLEHIVRTGGLKINDISTKNIIDTFGFKNVIFGESLPDKESKSHVKHFLGAISDLAEILNINIKSINEIAGLDINFASMGVRGHLATYFAPLKAINLSRGSGDGSVAHEWFHYFDNICAEGNTRSGSPDYLSKKSDWDYANSPLTNAFYNLKKYIKTGDKDSILKTSVRYEPIKNISFNKDVLKSTAEETILELQKKYRAYRDYDRHNKKNNKDIFGWIAFKFEKDYVDVEYENRTTKFYSNSVKIGTDYWIKDLELFARAFEAYIESLLDKKDRKNNYLVSYKNNWKSWDLQDIPYPDGDELVKISALFDTLFEAFKKDFVIGDFEPFTQERESEYIELESKKEVEETKPTKKSIKVFRGGKIPISEMDKGILYFTQSQDYAKNYGNVTSYNLYVNNILDLSDIGQKRFNPSELIQFLKSKINDISDSEISDILKNYEDINTNLWQFVYDYREKLKPILDRNNIDAIKLKESYDGDSLEYDSYAIFDKSKIKEQPLKEQPKETKDSLSSVEETIKALNDAVKTGGEYLDYTVYDKIHNALTTQEDRVTNKDEAIKMAKKNIADIRKGIYDKNVGSYENQLKKASEHLQDIESTDLNDKRFANFSTTNIIAKAYHKAKSDGSNPELVKAVEELLKQPQQSDREQIEEAIKSLEVANEFLNDNEINEAIQSLKITLEFL